MTDVGVASPWRLSWRADPRGRAIADRHYNRQAVGAAQFVPPGRCLTLWASGALWVTSWPFAEYVAHAWAGAWLCSVFRNERPDLYLSSDLIVAAVRATRWQWADVPPLGIVTFVDASATRRKRDPGRCFRRAGFAHVGFTGKGLVVLQMLEADMPTPAPPFDSQLSLFA